MMTGQQESVEYDESQWTPWFVHHFDPTVKHLAPQILEIFKNHPEAKAMMEKELGLKPGGTGRPFYQHVI